MVSLGAGILFSVIYNWAIPQEVADADLAGNAAVVDEQDRDGQEPAARDQGQGEGDEGAAGGEPVVRDEIEMGDVGALHMNRGKRRLPQIMIVKLP
jgi:hypothetical protein